MKYINNREDNKIQKIKDFCISNGYTESVVEYHDYSKFVKEYNGFHFALVFSERAIMYTVYSKHYRFQHSSNNYNSSILYYISKAENDQIYFIDNIWKEIIETYGDMEDFILPLVDLGYIDIEISYNSGILTMKLNSIIDLEMMNQMIERIEYLGFKYIDDKNAYIMKFKLVK